MNTAVDFTNDVLERLAADHYARAMKNGGAKTAPQANLHIIRTTEFAGPVDPTAHPLSSTDEPLVLSSEEQKLYDILEKHHLFGISGSLELSRKSMVRHLLRKDFAVLGTRDRNKVVVLFNDNPKHDHAVELNVGYFLELTCNAFYAASNKQELGLDNDQAAYYFHRAVNHQIAEDTGDMEVAPILRNVSVFRLLQPHWEPMAALGGVIPKDVFQIAQAELLTQLMDSMQSPPVDTMHDKIEARLNARLKAERQSQPEYRPSIHEVSWHLRAEATRAKRLGLELNKAAKMLPQVAGLLDWHARFNGNVPPKEVELIRDIFSVEGAPDAPQKMDREKMLRYLPTMMLVMYGRAAQEIMGKRADEVIFARSRRLITRFMGQKPLSQDL